MNRILIATALAAALTGCYHANYRTGLPSNGVTHDTKVHHFFFGLGGGDFDVGTMCPSGVAAVDTHRSFVDMLLTGLTGFLYSPTSVKVECAGQRAASR